MNDKPYPSFMDKKSLIPLKVLDTNTNKPDSFNLEAIEKQINAAGLSIDNFYYDPGKMESPFYYYRGSVLLDFPSIEDQIPEISALVSRISQDINESVAKRDFDRFFSLVDSRLAPELFVEVFNFIPDHDKFRLFEKLWRFNGNSAQVFNEKFIKQVSRYKGVTVALPAADEFGLVRVYMSQDSSDVIPEQVLTWAADVNIAILRALEHDPVPPVYQGLVHLDDIISYDNDRSKKTITVKPDSIKQAEMMPLINLPAFADELETSGIMELYRSLAGQINNQWFHNPQGIHALSHTKRVLLLSLIISYLEKFNEQDTNLLALASIYHDIGRKTDGYDPDHGIASYDKLVSENLLDLDNYHDRETLRFIIQNHAIPDQSACKKLNQYELADVSRTLRLYDAFKDADGLDRVRINDLNPEYLRTKSAHRLLLAAHQLYSRQILS